MQPPNLPCLTPPILIAFQKKQMVSGGFDILSHIMEIYFSEPNEDNVSDDISEALMRSAIRNLRAAIQNPQDYTAQSNLMWAATMAENRVIKLGKRMDFECHQMEHQLGAYTNCNHGEGLAVLHPRLLPLYLQIRLAEIQNGLQPRLWEFRQRPKRTKKSPLQVLRALEDFIIEIRTACIFAGLGRE